MLGTLSVGSLTWMLRAGSLLTGVFSSIPLWASMDPLPVLFQSRKDKKRRRQEVEAADEQEPEEEQMSHIFRPEAERLSTQEKRP